MYPSTTKPVGLKYTVASKPMWLEISDETTVGWQWEALWTELSSQQSVGLTVSKPHADKWPLQVDKLRAQGPCRTRPKLLPLLLAESDYRRALRTGRSLRAQGWANNKILSEGIFSFPKENGPSQCHIDDRILNLTLNQPFKKNEHCNPFMNTH